MVGKFGNPTGNILLRTTVPLRGQNLYLINIQGQKNCKSVLTCSPVLSFYHLNISTLVHRLEQTLFASYHPSHDNYFFINSKSNRATKMIQVYRVYGFMFKYCVCNQYQAIKEAGESSRRVVTVNSPVTVDFSLVPSDANPSPGQSVRFLTLFRRKGPFSSVIISDLKIRHVRMNTRV